MALPARFLSKVLKTDSCWLWTAAISDNDYRAYTHKSKYIPAHRYSFMILKGKLIKDLELDHLYWNRTCVNPDHLKQVTHATNMKRSITACKTSCNNGHELSGNNLYVSPRDKRECKTCRRFAVKRYYERKKP